jgi:hypothetical protein
VGLVEEQEFGIVQEGAAERQPLRHTAGEAGHALVARLPEAEPLEEHPAPLAPLGDVVEAPVEVEVLERRELAVDEGLVGEVPDSLAGDGDVELPARGREQARAQGKQRRLPGPVGAGDDEDVACADVEVEWTEDALLPEAPLQSSRTDHSSPAG